jgi:exopolyphosphatase/guanosine-5'-triphosphate,3'-diphosphate pyrophosphatase
MARYAAIDIGSNSVRMMAAEVVGDQTKVLAEDRQVTRLGESVFRDGRISEQALDFLSATLARMSASYSRLGVMGVRAVATSAVRDASNQDEFLQRTTRAVATDVEIISGAEEARLIHLGVEARWRRPKERTLIIDVGGGSAELIVSQNGQLIDAVSKPLGAVRLTEVFLRSDPPSQEEIHRLKAYIDEKLESFQKEHGAEKFTRTIATSATAAAIVSAANGIPRAKRDEADRQSARINQVRDLFGMLSKSDVAAKRKIPGIGPRRAEIVTAGTAVFLRALELFDLKAIFYCAAGVRDGIIADLAARGVGSEISQLSKEQRAIAEAMAKKYCVSLAHVKQVAFLSQRLFQILQPLHKLPPEAGRLLECAALLHDVGHFISNTGHHKHSAYLVENADLPGFTDKERLMVAALCRFHRKSLPQTRHPQYQALDATAKRTVMNLTPLIRIADSLDRGKGQRIKDLSGGLKDGSVLLQVQADEDVDLEVWTTNESAAKVFREVYQVPLVVQRTKARAI